jgi:hypothetical protein
MSQRSNTAASPRRIFFFKYLPLLLADLLIAAALNACPNCELAQPRILRGITHGVGPQNSWDYFITLAVSAITILVGFYSVKWLIRPGEANDNHIKNYILHNEVL